MWFNAIIHVESYQHLVTYQPALAVQTLLSSEVLHGCRQLVFCGVKLIFQTNATPKSGLRSSPHGLCMLGYTRVTRVKTTDYNKVILRDTKKLPQYELFSET